MTVVEQLERQLTDAVIGHQAGTAALEVRRARVADVEKEIGDCSRKIAMSNPKARDFEKLVAARSSARDRVVALKEQLAAAEQEHAANGKHVDGLRTQVERAYRTAALDAIRADAAQLNAQLSKFVRQLRPQVERHAQLVRAENVARGWDPAAWPLSRAALEPFSAWGLAAADPELAGFWNILAIAYAASAPSGGPGAMAEVHSGRSDGAR